MKKILPGATRSFWWLIGGLFAGLVAGFLLSGLYRWFPNNGPFLPSSSISPADLAAMPDGAKPLLPGPWGNLEALPIYIEPPEEYLPVRLIQEADRRWRFGGMSSADIMNLFQDAGLTDLQKAELMDQSKWSLDGDSILVPASRETILSLSPDSRKKIYSVLTSDPNSIFSLYRCSFPADKFEAYFDNSGLPSETVALVKKLSFRHGRLVFFYNIPTVLDTLSDPGQKLRLLKTLLRKNSLLLRLHITPQSDVDALAHYWIRAGWGIDLRPMLESLAQVPQGARIDVVELFPPVPSAQIFTFPFPSLKPEDAHKDCHWTSLNFFRDIPDQRFTDANTVRQTYLTDYYPVLSDPRYGDIVLLAKPNGQIIHSAVFIADNIVYTKNSANFRDPFIFMTMPDLLDIFTAQIPEGQELQVSYLRNKYY